MGIRKNFLLPLVSLIFIFGFFGVFALSTTTNLSQKGDGVSELSFFDGKEVAHLASPKIIDTTVHEGRINIVFDTPITLNDLETIYWDFSLNKGYLPHVDVFLGTGVVLIVEGAHQNGNEVIGWATNTWLQTFDGVTCDMSTHWATGLSCPNDLTTVNDETNVWRSGIGGTAGTGSSGQNLQSLATYKSGWNDVSGTDLVTHLEIEVDGWVAESEAYVDNIRVNGEIVETFDEAPVIANVFIEPEFPNLSSTLVKVFASITDDRSGVDFADLFWRVKGDDTINTATFTGPFSGGWAGIAIGDPKDGVIIEYHIKAVDNSGNTAWDPSINTFYTFTYDGSAPTTTDNAPSSWADQDVTITLTCGDTISGCKEIFYSTDGSNPTILFTSPFTLSETGQHQLKYFSRDNAGNQELTVTGALVQIDKEIPTITDNYTNNNGVWVNSPQTVTLNPQDTGGSGIASVKTCKGSDCTPSNPLDSPHQLFFSESQNIIVRYQTFDVAKNPSEIGEFNVKIDKTTPVTNDNIPANWQNTAFDIILSVSEDGFSPTITNYKFWRVDETEPTTFSQGNLIKVNVDGEYNLKYFSEDEARNIEVVKTASNLAKLDTLSPQVFIDGDLPSDWRNGLVTLSVQCNDGLSKCDSNSFAVIGVPEETIDCSTVDYSGGAISFVANSHVHLCAKASDNAGNTGFSEVTEVLIENEAPTVTITSNPSTDKMDFFIVKADVSDMGGSELKSAVLTLRNATHTFIDGAPMTLVLNENHEFLLRMWELVAGGYTLEVTATDNAGNSFTHTQEFTILQNVAPSRITSTNNQVDAATGGTVSFDFDVVVRNNGRIRFSMDDVAGLSPHFLNARISDGTTNVSVGRGIDFIGAGILDLEDLDLETPNVQGTFTLHLDIPKDVIPGNYPINYFIDVA